MQTCNGMRVTWLLGKTLKEGVVVNRFTHKDKVKCEIVDLHGVLHLRDEDELIESRETGEGGDKQ